MCKPQKSALRPTSTYVPEVCWVTDEVWKWRDHDSLQIREWHFKSSTDENEGNLNFEINLLIWGWKGVGFTSHCEGWVGWIFSAVRVTGVKVLWEFTDVTRKDTCHLPLRLTFSRNRILHYHPMEISQEWKLKWLEYNRIKNYVQETKKDERCKLHFHQGASENW